MKLRLGRSTAEHTVAENLQAQGYEILKRGWPDFLAIRGNEVRLIEVKCAGQNLKPQQAAVAEALARCGLIVEVVCVDVPRGERLTEVRAPRSQAG